MGERGSRKIQDKGKWHDNARQRKGAQDSTNAKRVTSRTHDSVKVKPGTGKK